MATRGIVVPSDHESGVAGVTASIRISQKSDGKGCRTL